MNTKVREGQVCAPWPENMTSQRVHVTSRPSEGEIKTSWCRRSNDIVRGPTVLSTQVEREIALACTTLADMGFGLTKDLIDVVIVDYLKDNGIENPFAKNVPGKDWWQRFMKRWPILSERKPQHLSTKRAQAGNRVILNAWFDKVVLSNAGLDRIK